MFTSCCPGLGALREAALPAVHGPAFQRQVAAPDDGCGGEEHAGGRGRRGGHAVCSSCPSCPAWRRSTSATCRSFPRWSARPMGPARAMRAWRPTRRSRPSWRPRSTPDVDAVLTVREFGRLLRLVGVELHGAVRGALRQPAGALHRRGHHFRTHRRRHGGGPTLGSLPHHRREPRFQRLRYHGRHAGDALDVPRACRLATPRCASLWPAAWRIRRSCWTRWKSGEAAFDFVEIMACPGRMRGRWRPAHPRSTANWPRRSGRRAEPARRRRTRCATPTRTPTSRSCTPIGSASRCRIRPTSGCTPIRRAGRFDARASWISSRASTPFPRTSTPCSSTAAPRRWPMSWLAAPERRARPSTETAVFARGLIEFTNVCKNDCYYCGIRRSNGACERYRLTREQILACADDGLARRASVPSCCKAGRIRLLPTSGLPSLLVQLEGGSSGVRRHAVGGGALAGKLPAPARRRGRPLPAAP